MSDKLRSTSLADNKAASDDGKGSEEDCAVDSGFIAGHSDIQYFSGEIDSCDSQDPEVKLAQAFDSEVSMRLDSGVDVGLTDSFSGLSLQQDKQRNDLSSTDVGQDVPALNISAPEERREPQPWQIYFQQDDEGDTQLHIAIVSGLTEAVLALLHMCPHPALLDIRNDSGRAPIHLAVLTSQPHIARRLLIAGAKVNTRDCDGNTALHLASASGQLSCLRALTAPLALVPATAGVRSLPHALDQKNYDGETCVHLAAIRGHIDILQHLVWFGANINATENKGGRTALHLAIEHGQYAVLRYLLGECPLVWVGARTYSGHTALQLGGEGARQQLISAGYSPPPQDTDTETDSDQEDSDDDIQYGDNAYFSSNIRGGEAINVA